jgi:hypothetical protein
LDWVERHSQQISRISGNFYQSTFLGQCHWKGSPVKDNYRQKGLSVKLFGQAHFAVYKPLAFAMVNVFHCPVIVEVENLARIYAHTEEKPPHVERPTIRRYRRMGGTHIPRHFAAPGEIAPLGKHLDNGKLPSLPEKAVWARRAFLLLWRLVEFDSDGFIQEMDGDKVSHGFHPENAGT